ncbi:unnamed protein product, partial [Candidula unifasciata]
MLTSTLEKDKTARMSEEKCLIQQSETGDISASFSQSKASVLNKDDLKENLEPPSNVDEIPLTDQVSNQQGDLKQSADDINEVADEEALFGDTEGIQESEFQYCSNEDLNFVGPTGSSTPLLARATSEGSVTEETSDLKTSSLTRDCCLTGDPDEDNDNISQVSCGCSYHEDGECTNVPVVKAQPRESLMIPGAIQVPIVGHETMEARSKFTVFKIHVMIEEDEVGWFIFRRYSDFVHLNDQLRVLYPSFRFTLPPKRWLRSNFDLDFLEERQKGLQIYVDNITGHRDICNSKPVRDFFCFDDPPGPYDSLEESRAQCECMEEMVYLLRKELSEKDTEMELLKEELNLYKNQVQLLTSRLSELNKVSTVEKPASEKRRSLAGDGRFSIASMFGSSDLQLISKLDTIADF